MLDKVKFSADIQGMAKRKKSAREAKLEMEIRKLRVLLAMTREVIDVALEILDKRG